MEQSKFAYLAVVHSTTVMPSQLLDTLPSRHPKSGNTCPAGEQNQTTLDYPPLPLPGAVVCLRWQMWGSYLALLPNCITAGVLNAASRHTRHAF